MKLLPKEFTEGLSKFASEFLGGVWHGMGPDLTKGVGHGKTKKKRIKKVHKGT